MGGKGPAPTPTNILKARGSWKVNERKDEPEYETVKPKMPAWLDKEAKKEWRQIAPQLANARVLTKVDCIALARYCQLVSRWKQAEIFLIEHGMTYVDKFKSTHPFPQIKISKDCADQLLRMEHEFGLTPSARTRIKAAPETKEKPKGGKDKARFFNKKLG